MPMRRRMCLTLLARCGRFGVDVVGNGRTAADAVGAPSGGLRRWTHELTGRTACNAGTATSISIPTAPLADTNMVIVVAIHWKSGTSSVATVQDSFGNGFSMLGSMTRYNASSQVMWFKRVTAGTTINVLL